MSDTKKLKPTKEMKHLVCILGVAAHAAKTDHLPNYTTKKKVIKSIEYFQPRVNEEMKRLGIPAPIELTEKQKKQIAEEIGKLINIIVLEEGAAKDEAAE